MPFSCCCLVLWFVFFSWFLLWFFSSHFCYSLVLIGVNRMVCNTQFKCPRNMILSYDILKFCTLSSITFSIFLIILGLLVISSC